MPLYDNTITDFVAGDDFTIGRTITNIPDGQVITKVWFTIKSSFSKTDVQATLQKIITDISVPDVGQIDDTGADNTGHVYIYLTPDDTALLTPYAEYKYDIQVKLSGGGITTPETGIIVALPQVTQATT